MPIDALDQEITLKVRSIIGYLNLTYPRQFKLSIIDNHAKPLKKNPDQEILSRFDVEFNKSNLSSFFQIPEPVDFGKWFEEGTLLQNHTGVDYLLFRERIHFADPQENGYSSSFPTMHLRVVELIRGEVYLGITLFNRIAAHHYFSAIVPECYTDEAGLIKGWNHAFILASGEVHDSLWDRHIETVVRGITESTGLPRQALEKKQPLPWKAERSFFFKAGEANGLDKLNPRVRPEETGLLWESPEGANADLLEVIGVFDYSGRSCKVEVYADVLKGFPPGLILQANTFNPFFPDSDGFHFTYSGRGAALLKKCGHVRLTRPLAACPVPGPVRIEIAKHDDILVETVNGLPQLEYLDMDPVSSGHPLGLMLSLMPGSICRLREIHVHVLAAPPLPREEALIPLRFDKRPDAQYHVQQACTEHEGRNVFSYQFINMSRYYRLRREHEKVVREKESLQAAAGAAERRTRMLGKSEPLRKILETVAGLPDYPLTITIEGETGTGKEVLAHTIHEESARSRGPFVKLDLSTLSGTLIESELFGHEKGAFTGALDRRIGRIEQSDGGTLFLDEIANLSLELQAKLLDFLETFSFVRVGGHERLKVNVRVIVASNQDLADRVKKGLFREDFWYRIQLINLRLPPLRERLDDVPLLAAHFMDQAASAMNRPVKGVTPEALKKLMAYSWPGNVRELKNVIFRSVIAASGPHLSAGDILIEIPASVTVTPPPGVTFRRRYKREQVEEMLTSCFGNVQETARRLGIDRSTVFRILKRT